MLAHHCRTALLLLLAAIVVVMGIVGPLTGLLANWCEWVVWPYLRMVLLVGLFVTSAASGSRRWPRASALFASASLLGVWSSFRVLTMGDGYWWRHATSEGTISYAEPVSSLVYGFTHELLGAAAIEWISPAVGFVATYVWIRATDRLFAREPAGAAYVRLLAALFWAASGVCTLFFHRYVEHTQLGIPLVTLGLANLTVWSRDVVRAVPHLRSKTLFVGVAQLTLAALTHLQYAGLWVAGLGAAMLVGLRTGVRRSLQNAAGAAIVAAALIACTIGVARSSPFRPVVGSIAGGADNRWLVLWTDASGSWFGPGTLLAPDHLALIAHVLAFACPLCLPFALVVLATWRRRRSQPPDDLVLVGTALAYVAFVSLYGFDLGWPRDADLMIAMSGSLSLLVAGGVIAAAGQWAARRRTALVIVMCALAFANWSVIAALVRPAWTNICQRNSAEATLLVDGIGEGAAPFHVHAQRGESVRLEASGPPGAAFWICKGLPSPAWEGHPYGGVADIELTNGIEVAAFVHAGVFDAAGQASLTWKVEPLADGRNPGLQMIVFRRSGASENTTSAAFYFDLQ
ncbi:MAG TPA: hypothetical protein VFZ65_04285 [Planctomycetota bacterium]|nr:hypothetical protein [Planctomycetota bacterium]